MRRWRVMWASRAPVLWGFLGGMAGLVSGCAVVDQQAVPVVDAGRPLTLEGTAVVPGQALQENSAPKVQVMVPRDSLPALRVSEEISVSESAEKGRSKVGVPAGDR